ncbi:hypothetical protein PQR05_36515 [Paraburkholderia sediminicola]|uniref:hypothetical protein n=1 Tax=Paraburkholderia sediminicola TaxID=458836 RepID=UPI0038BD7341
MRLACLPFYEGADLKDVAPERWRTEDFDLLFNHRNNEGCSVLYEIEHLADGCRAKKQVLMRSVAGELDMLRQGAPDALAELIPSLGDVLFRDPAYLQGHDAFAIWLLDGLLGDGTVLLDGRLGDTALQALGVHAGRLLEAEGMAVVTGRSAAICQVLYAMRQRAAGASSPVDRQRWTGQAATLQKRYVETLQTFMMKRLLRQPGNWQGFGWVDGDYFGPAIWVYFGSNSAKWTSLWQ